MKFFLITIFLFYCFTTYGQKESNWWFFGTRGGVNFNCSPPMPISGISHFILEGCATISDSNGDFLFTTNGDTIWDRHFNPMPNGFDLAGKCDRMGDSGTQPALIIPKPGSSTLYYIFTTDCVEDTLVDGLEYSIVDMSLNNGNGDVILKNQLLFTPSSEKIAAIKNGNDYWIVSHEFGTNNFYSYSLTNAGLSSPVISPTGQVHFYIPTSVPLSVRYPEQLGRGYLKFSPDGNKLISLEVPDESIPILQYVLHPEIFSFDKATGTILSQFVINHPDSLPYYGASFSPDGSKLYLSGAWYHQYLHQFDLAAGLPIAIVNSRTVVNLDTNNIMHSSQALQLATDGKIYIATGRQWLDAINNPDSLGLACNYQYKQIMLRNCPVPTYSSSGTPNFVESYFQTPTLGSPCLDFIAADFSATDTCFNNITQFNDLSTIYPETIHFWKWDFDDLSSGASNFSNLQNPTHQFSTNGTFNVKLISMTDTTVVCKSDTVNKIVTIQSCTGIQERNNSFFEVVVFPNPASENFHLQIQPKKQMTIYICIYDVTGGLIQKFTQEIVKKTSFEFGGDLATGMYFLELRSNNIVFTYKLTKF